MSIGYLRAGTVLITGISASGKSTLGSLLKEGLLKNGVENLMLLDGEEIREQLKKRGKNYGYSTAERNEVALEIARLASEYNRKGTNCIICSICHIKAIRKQMRRIIGRVMEVYLDCPVSVCAQRDYKGNYKKAFNGLCHDFIGVSEPYQRSYDEELVLHTGSQPVGECSAILLESAMDFLERAEEKVVIAPNCNYHIAGGNGILESSDAKFREYRRRWTEYPRNFTVGDFPLHLDIESTNLCNLNCPYCAVSSDFWGKSEKGFLPFPLFKKVIDHAVENGVYSIKLSLRGEPLLHKQIAEMVAYARKKGVIDIYFNTNAVFLTEDTCNLLIDAGLNRISISADGWNKESFEKNRRGAEFKSVYDNIAGLRKIRRDRGVDFPKIRIQAVMLDEIKAHWAEYLKLWQPLADELGYLDAREEGPGIDHRGLTGNWACPFLWQRMVILCDGSLLPCLMHGIEDLSLMSLGNVKDLDIKTAWQSQRCDLYRGLHREGRSHKIEACDRCSYRALEIKKTKDGFKEALI